MILHIYMALFKFISAEMYLEILSVSHPSV